MRLAVTAEPGAVNEPFGDQYVVDGLDIERIDAHPIDRDASESYPLDRVPELFLLAEPCADRLAGEGGGQRGATPPSVELPHLEQIGAQRVALCVLGIRDVAVALDDCAELV